MVASRWAALAACFHINGLLMWDIIVTFATIWIVSEHSTRKHEDYRTMEKDRIIVDEYQHNGQGPQPDG